MMNTVQIINQRRLVQDVYDKRTLHHLLGLHPGSDLSPNVDDRRGRVIKRERSSQLKSKAIESFQPLSDDAVEPIYSSSNHRNEDEQGRYGIEQRRFKKLRKLRGQDDVHTVFTNDAEETDEELVSFGGDDAGDSDNDDQEYDLIVEDLRGRKAADRSPRTARKIEGKRSYWLSKGIGKGDESDY